MNYIEKIGLIGLIALVVNRGSEILPHMNDFVDFILLILFFVMYVLGDKILDINNGWEE